MAQSTPLVLVAAVFTNTLSYCMKLAINCDKLLFCSCFNAMMVQSTVLVVVLLINILTYCSAENVYYILMFILPSKFSQLHHTLWVCMRILTVFYLWHHYGVLARWPCSWYINITVANVTRLMMYMESFHRTTNQKWLAMGQLNWSQLYKYGGLQARLFSFCLLQQGF